jgi:hydrogenase maturation protease
MSSKWNTPDSLLVGIGNSGRHDDGLGWQFVKRLEKDPSLNLKCRTELRYQLQVEDAELISRFRQVVFVDATHESIEGGYIQLACRPSEKYAFTTHQSGPETILALCQRLYNQYPEVVTLKIQGELFELGEGLSPGAEHNLRKALTDFCGHHLAFEASSDDTR